MFEKVESIKKEIKGASAENESQLEEYRKKFISRKSIIAQLFEDFKHVPNEKKKAFGQALNELKSMANAKFQSLIETVNNAEDADISNIPDRFLPPIPNQFGGIHPITPVKNRM